MNVKHDNICGCVCSSKNRMLTFKTLSLSFSPKKIIINRRMMLWIDIVTKQTYLAFKIIGLPPLGGINDASCVLLFPIAPPITRLTVSSTVSGPVDSVVELYTDAGPVFKDTYPPSNVGICYTVLYCFGFFFIYGRSELKHANKHFEQSIHIQKRNRLKYTNNMYIFSSHFYIPDNKIVFIFAMIIISFGLLLPIQSIPFCQQPSAVYITTVAYTTFKYESIIRDFINAESSAGNINFNFYFKFCCFFLSFCRSFCFYLGKTKWTQICKKKKEKRIEKKNKS